MYQANPGLTNKGWQVLQTDYNNASDLRFKLAGVDTVISTVSGNAQLNLIDAAAAAQTTSLIIDDEQPSHGCSSMSRKVWDTQSLRVAFSMNALLQGGWQPLRLECEATSDKKASTSWTYVAQKLSFHSTTKLVSQSMFVWHLQEMLLALLLPR
jgi:hypothetical protein